MNELDITQEAKQGSKSHKKKKTVIITVISLVLVGVSIGVILFLNKKKNSSNANGVSVCSMVGELSANEISVLINANEYKKLEPVVKDINNNSKASNDPDCQYILLGYSIVLSNPAEATKHLNKINEITSDYDPTALFGSNALSLSTYAENIKFFEEQSKNNNGLYVGNGEGLKAE